MPPVSGRVKIKHLLDYNTASAAIKLPMAQEKELSSFAGNRTNSISQHVLTPVPADLTCKGLFAIARLLSGEAEAKQQVETCTLGSNAGSGIALIPCASVCHKTRTGKPKIQVPETCNTGISACTAAEGVLALGENTQLGFEQPFPALNKCRDLKTGSETFKHVDCRNILTGSKTRPPSFK